MNALDSIYGSATLTKLFRIQNGKCADCKTEITATDIRSAEIHKHHMKPRSLGGDWKLSNLRLLHKACHRELHATFTREEMARYITNGIDYLRLLKGRK
jgi:5-methylcytosine-specific restriction endonuclease McrA